MTARMLRIRIIPAVVTACLLASASAGAAESFLAEYEDLPLAPGLTETPGGMLFDAPNGRIVEAQASGDVPAQQVEHFYAQTLPQLGWTAAGGPIFRRDNEVLRIDVDSHSKPTQVHFSVVPQ